MHVTLGDVLATHWADVETFGYFVLILLLAKLVLGR